MSDSIEPDRGPRRARATPAWAVEKQQKLRTGRAETLRANASERGKPKENLSFWAVRLSALTALFRSLFGRSRCLKRPT